MKVYMFPGQGSQFPGMAKDLYETDQTAREMFDRANEILGFNITDIMFDGTAEELKQTRVTQPAIFLHSVIAAKCCPDFKPDMVAGHSLGEFSALTAAGALDFEDGLIANRIRYSELEELFGAVIADKNIIDGAKIFSGEVKKAEYLRSKAKLRSQSDSLSVPRSCPQE